MLYTFQFNKLGWVALTKYVNVFHHRGSHHQVDNYLCCMSQLLDRTWIVIYFPRAFSEYPQSGTRLSGTGISYVVFDCLFSLSDLSLEQQYSQDCNATLRIVHKQYMKAIAI